FQHHNQLYRLERELDLKPRKGLDRGKGIGTSKASLAVVDAVGGLELDKLAGKSKETNQAVVDLLGLTSEQFKQIILLPQYQFSQFLKSPTSEKLPILRQIFATQVFAKFEEDLVQKWSQAKQEQSQFQTALDAHFASQIWTIQEREAFAEASGDQGLSLAQTRLKHYQSELEEAEKQKARAQKEAKQADQTYQVAQKLASQFQDRQAQEARYQTEILDQAEAYQKKQAKLAQLNFAASLADLVKEEKSKQATGRELENSIASLQADLTAGQRKLKPLEEQLSRLQGQQAQVEASQAEIETLRLALNSAQTLAKEQSELQSAQASLTKLEKDQKDLAQQEQQVQQTQANLQASLISDQDLFTLRSVKEEAQGLIAGDLATGLEKQVDLQEAGQKLAERRTTSLGSQVQLEADLAVLQDRLKASKRDQLKLMVAKLQDELEDGSPCPVCGSLDHPGSQAGAVDEGALANLSQRVENLEAELAQKQEALQAQQLEVSQLSSQLIDNKRFVQEQSQALEANYQTLQEKISAYLPDFIWEETYSQELSQKLKDQLKQSYQALFDRKAKQDQQLEGLAQNLANLNQAQQKVQEGRASLSGQIKTLERSRKQLLQAHPDLQTPDYYEAEIAQRREAYQAFRQKFDSCQKQVANQKEVLSGLEGGLSSQKESLQTIQADLDSLSQDLEARLADPAALTHDLSQLEAWLAELADGQQVTLQTWLTKYQQNREQVEASLAQFNQLLADQEKPDLQALAQKKEAAELALNQAASQLALSQHQLDQVEHLVTEIEQLLAQAGHHLEEFRQLSQLKNIISGTETGSQRLKLETYVIQAYLEEILTYANDHYIGLLSNRQFEFLIGKEGAGNSQSGLDINIYDRANNKELPASSLSGGETFIASLAIALSLSEVVQNTSNGALVETLFIDEGFGSLDEDTLDKAIAVLEQIGQNRLVGVISHVKEMKDTIQQQVLIDKGPDGSSRIRVKAD
ncbi:SbcC/MukB-like Walker B domain-containing protein, partial [Streptococcus sobrinus]